MASNAEEYADSLSHDISAMTDAGSPFGWINDETGEWYGVNEAEHTDIEDGWTEASAGDYLSDVLDIQYLVTSDREYRSARILIAFGGPNAWIDTRTGQLEVSWWSAPEYRELPAAFIDGLDEFLAEMWEMGA